MPLRLPSRLSPTLLSVSVAVRCTKPGRGLPSCTVQALHAHSALQDRPALLSCSKWLCTLSSGRSDPSEGSQHRASVCPLHGGRRGSRQGTAGVRGEVAAVGRGCILTSVTHQVKGTAPCFRVPARSGGSAP